MPKRASRPPQPVASRRALAAALAFSLAGVGVALALVRLHQRAHAGLASFCAISDQVNCDRVAVSPYSVVLGLPVAVWGVLGFALLAVLAGWGLSRRRAHPAWPAGLLLLASGGAVAASVALAAVSEFVIGAFCILCAAAWTLAAASFVAALRAVRPVGAGAAVRADLDALRARPGLAGAAVVLALGATAGAAAAYPRYWDKPEPPRSQEGAAAPRVAQGPGATLVIEEFSDYDCPYCAQSYEKVRARLRGRTDVRIVHRHFPLDASCNPAVKRAIHAQACELARAAVCATAQGRGDDMDALLFRTQGRRLPPTELATRLGLDVPAFRACLASKEAAEKVAADVAEGIRLGIRATPTFVVDGVPHSGELPAGLLDPRP